MNLIRNIKEFIIDYFPYIYAIHNLVIKNNFHRKDALKSVNNILRDIV